MIDFTRTITDFNSDPIDDQISMQSNGGCKVELTLGRAAAHALCMNFSDEQNVDGAEKFRRGKLAFEIRDAADRDVPAEDLTLIKKLMAKLYSPMVIFRAYQMLDPAEK